MIWKECTIQWLYSADWVSSDEELLDDVSERVSARGQHAQLSHRHFFDRQVRNYIKEIVTRVQDWTFQRILHSSVHQGILLFSQLDVLLDLCSPV